MPLFSLITVTYQNLDGLQKTAASTTAQSFTDYEWIIIDGGSTDGSKDFLKSTSADWISEPDNGIYDAMNKGIDRAAGDYLIFMNAGDQFASPDTLDQIATAIKGQASAPDLIYGDALEELQNGETILKPARNHRKWAYGMFTHHQAMIYNRAFIHDKNLKYDTHYSIAADYKLTLQLIQNNGIIFNIKGISVCIFESGGVSQRHVRDGRTEQFQIRKELHAVPIWKNVMIYILQTGAYQIQRFCPRLYWLLKSRRNRNTP